MATLASLASRYDPNSPNYDPTAMQTLDPATQPVSMAPPATLAPPPIDTMAASKALTDANKVTATTQTYNEGTGVAGRVNALTSGGGPLMQTARTQAAQQAAQRGLVNSSLGVQAGEQAVINTATPIATADAQLTSQQNINNQNALNAASTTNAQLGVTAGVQGLSLTQQAQQFGVTSRQSQEQITNQAAQFRQNLDMQQKQVDAQISQFAQSLGIQVGDLALRRDTLTAQQRQALDQLNLQRSQLAQQQTQFDASQGQQSAQFAATQRQQLVMQAADDATKKEVSTIEATWRQQISGNTNIANAWGTMMQGIQAIQNNSALDNDTKRQLIANTTAGFASFADFWQTTTGIDVSNLTRFNVGNVGNISAPANNPAPGYDPGRGPPSVEAGG